MSLAAFTRLPPRGHGTGTVPRVIQAHAAELLSDVHGPIALKHNSQQLVGADRERPTPTAARR